MIIINKAYVRNFRLLIDLLLISGIYFVCNLIIFSRLIIEPNELLIILSILTLWYFTSKKTELYDEFRISRFYSEVFRLLNNIIWQMLLLIVIFFALSQSNITDYRLFILIYIPTLSGVLIIQKYLYRQIFIYLRSRGKNIKWLIIIGTGKVGLNFYNTIINNPHFGYKIAGFIDDKISNDLHELYIGNLDYFIQNLDKYDFVDEIIISNPEKNDRKIEKIITKVRGTKTRVKIIPEFISYGRNRFNVDMFGAFPLITMREDPLELKHNQLVKRFFDIIFSLIFLITIFSWLFPIIALIILIDSKGSILFIQERWGKNNKSILCYKFRSMTNNSSEFDNNGSYKQATKNDTRITKIGHFLRKSNLDELPQFINVLLGDMSVVGPRPHPVPLNIESKSKINNYLLRHLVKPGITGWAQVKGFRGETREIHLMKKRVQYDIHYIENWSPLFDLKIIFLTVWNMIKGEKNAY